jgi:hypothetical protein
MIGITVVALAALFAAVPAPDRAGASCGQIVVWHDMVYDAGWWNPADLPAFHTGRQLRGAVVPDCADTGGPAAAPTRPCERRRSTAYHPRWRSGRSARR